MTDSLFTSQSAAGGDSKIDNELVTTTAGIGLLRQRVRIGGSVGTLLAEVANDSLLVGHKQERKDGQIGAWSGFGSIGATGSDQDVIASSVLVLAPLVDHSSWTVQLTGAWTGSLVTEATNDIVVAIPGQPTLDEINAATWVPIQSRQSNGGALSNTSTANGLDRGVYGGLRAFRVRAAGTAFTGTANVSITLGEQAATFQNSNVLALTQEEYTGSVAGGNANWSVASQDIALPSGNGEVPVLILTNQDSAGGRTIILNRMDVSANQACRFRRYRTTTLARTSGGTRVSPVNQGTAVASTGTETAALVYAGTAIAFTGVTLGTTTYGTSRYIGSAGGNSGVDIKGATRIPPGQSIMVTAVQPANSTIVNVEFLFSDGSTLT